MRVALINTNRMRPVIAPIGLEYVAEALAAEGHGIGVCDLCWGPDAETTVRGFFRMEYDLVGLSFRNTDDCAVIGRQSFIPELTDTVALVRRFSAAPVVVGGVGFSVMPEIVLRACGADAGVCGEGEFSLAALARCMARGDDWLGVPNLLIRHDGGWFRTRAETGALDALPVMTRRWVDHTRYFREGGQGGIETKRGCPCACVYCADPVAKGRHVRVRSPAAVADEVAHLLAQGVDHLHTCDCEFNIPEDHALAVCRKLIERGLASRLRWYAYCSPAPFSAELADAMARAGCVGINFGVDNGDADMLRRLQRGFGPEDIAAAARACHEAGITVMFDLLLGSPGETRQSLSATIDLMKRSDATRIGVSVGVILYPGTALHARLCPEGGAPAPGVHPDHDAGGAAAYIDPAIAPVIYSHLDRLIGDDERFLFFDPTRPDRNYNYNANQRLVDAIADGARGAYWDILRRLD